jgi:hypothetical protein
MTETIVWEKPIIWLAECMRPYNREIATAMIATLLVIFGGFINNALRRVVRKQVIWVRVAAFIGLCTFGYGALTIWLTPIVAVYLMNQSAGMYVASIVLSFVFIGVLAENFQKSKQ